MSDNALAQEEQWDDSELLTSWNEAFAEYKKYHSVAAKDGKIDPPATADKTGLTNGDKPSLATTNAKQPQDEAADSDEYDASVGQASKRGQAVDATSPQFSAAPAGGAAMPQLLAADIQDDNMKKLMMSWYYAGYYTGLYEGKQQGYASALKEVQQGG